jgi:hypothetical protein
VVLLDLKRRAYLTVALLGCSLMCQVIAREELEFSAGGGGRGLEFSHKMAELKGLICECRDSVEELFRAKTRREEDEKRMNDAKVRLPVSCPTSTIHAPPP